MLFFDEIFSALGNDYTHASKITVSNSSENLPSWFETSDLAVATMATAGFMASQLLSYSESEVIIDKRLASLWFDMTIRPIGWELPPIWDTIAGDYQTADGWIRLHTNAPHHRDAALSVLGDYADRENLRPVVAQWKNDELEHAIVSANGCAAAMRRLEDWSKHPHGQTLSTEPLIDFIKRGDVAKTPNTKSLKGLKVLDLTRVLAGPIATRFLTGLGYDAEALRYHNPKLIDVYLSAYGWAGSWATRRGFDSLVQMSSGIANYGMETSGADKPTPLPVQALDHSTGYLIAAAVLKCLKERADTGTVLSARLSLARVAHLLTASKREALHAGMAPEISGDCEPVVERTVWGDAKHIRFPLLLDGIPFEWAYPAGRLRTSKPEWL